MAYRDLREFIAQLEQLGELKRVSASVSPHLEMTALCDRTLRADEDTNEDLDVVHLQVGDVVLIG